jgi:hypothetical protein
LCTQRHQRCQRSDSLSIGLRPGVFPMRGRRAAKSPQHSDCGKLPLLSYARLVAASAAMGYRAKKSLGEEEVYGLKPFSATLLVANPIW